ncbi:M28 family peptidase [Crocinitomicaceae bacterium]|nr:M28 family peptidase [Crocinitomicaceae bacterium]MDB3906422.1 M28 family peptidase [Crocinitomicaceae bacterium]
MKALILSLLLSLPGLTAHSQTFDAFYASMADSCNQDTVTEYLQQFEDLGVKELLNAGLDNTKDWIIQKYQDWGYTDIVEDDFQVQGVTTTNIIITKTGTLYPDTYVIIDGHYDTKNGPGANDNGSGTVILLEIARLIKDIPTEYSIKFIHFSAEEIGLEGSEHYVDNVANPSNLDVKVLFNIDQVGGTGGETNNTIVCERDQSPPNGNNAQSDIYTNELAVCTQLYSNLQTEISFAYGSDYVPFMQDGYVVTGFYEENESIVTHSINDSISNMDLDYLYQVTKASMGALLHFSVAYQELGIDEVAETYVNLFPNPADNYLRLTLSKENSESLFYIITDLSGKSMLESMITGTNGSFEIDTRELAPGAYILKLETSQGKIARRFIKE